MPFIASTLSTAVQYTGYKSAGNDLPQVAHSVTIAGGANVANRHIITPRGIITEVTNDDVAFLEANDVFKVHKENGFVQVLDSKPADADDVATDMNTRDNSAPLVDQDFTDDKKPTAAGKKGK